MSNPNSIVAEIQTTMQAMKDENAKVVAALQDANKQTGAQATEALTAAKTAAEKITALATAIVEMEQKLAENVNRGRAPIETLGQMVIATEGFKQMALGNSRSFRIEANTITGQEGSPPVNSGTLVEPYRLPGIVGGPFRALRVSDIIPQGTITGNMLNVTRELLFTNNAAEVAEGAQKPESTLTFELKPTPVATIAHWLKVSKQVLEDAPALASYIDNRLRYGVDVRYDAQLLNGDGVGQNISGITDTGNFTPFTPLTGYTILDNINLAIEKVRLADYEATGIVLNPADWGNIERLKDLENRYVVGNPLGMIGPSLWGKPVVVTNAMTAGKILVGAFDISHQIFNRSGTVVEMFEQDETNVQKNLVTVRAERRGLLATFRPASVYYGNATL